MSTKPSLKPVPKVAAAGYVGIALSVLAALGAVLAVLPKGQYQGLALVVITALGTVGAAYLKRG